MDRQRMLNAIRSLRALTDEEYSLVLEAVSRTAPAPDPVAPKAALTGKAPKGSTLASERAKKAWKTRKRNEKKRQQQEEAAGGNQGGGATDTAAADRVAGAAD